MEIWKTILGFNMYEVSNFGNIRSLFNGKKRMITKVVQHGYFNVTLYNKNIKKKIQVHRLVAIAFIPNPENKTQVNHISGIKNDNRVDNLEWCTPSENIIHAYRNGLKKGVRGSKSNFSILKEEDILQIKNTYNKGELSQLQIAKMYNISQSAVSLIVNNKRWKY